MPDKKILANATNVSQAWNKFKRSGEYTKLMSSLKHHGYKDPYMDHYIKDAFYAGFKASGVKIENIRNESINGNI